MVESGATTPRSWSVWHAVWPVLIRNGAGVEHLSMARFGYATGFCRLSVCSVVLPFLTKAWLLMTSLRRSLGSTFTENVRVFEPSTAKSNDQVSVCAGTVSVAVSV